MEGEVKTSSDDLEGRFQITEKRFDDVKTRFDDFDKRFQTLEKRFDDIKWTFGGASAVFAVVITIVMSLFTFVGSSNINSEKNELLNFENNLRADVGKAESIPDVEILGTDLRPLEGQVVHASVRPSEKGEREIFFSSFLRNKGSASSGQMFIKVYANPPIHLSDEYTDETLFKYSSVGSPTSVEPNDIPGGYSNVYNWDFFINKEDVPSGRYPALLKVYFGKGKVAQAHFVFDVQR